MQRLTHLWTFIYHCLHPFKSIIDHRAYLVLFYFIQQIQFIDMSDLERLVENQELAQLVTLFRVFSIYKSFDQTFKMIFQYFLVASTISVIILYFRNAQKVPFEMKIIILVMIMIFRIPAKVIGLELLIEMEKVEYALIGSVNFCFACILHVVWVYFGRANSVELDSPYNQLYYGFNVPLLAIILNGFQQEFPLFITTIIYLLLETWQMLYFASPINRGQVIVLSIVLPTYVCFYLQTPITTLLLVCSFYYNLLANLHQQILNHIITQEDQNVVQMIQLISSAVQQYDYYKIAMIRKNHQCPKCKSIEQIINCIYEGIARKSRDKQQITLLNAYHFASQKPIKSIIYLLNYYNNCDLYHKIAYQQAVLHLYDQIEVKCQITYKSPNRLLNESNELAEKSIQMAKSILHSQMHIWKAFSMGLETLDMYIRMIRKMAVQIKQFTLIIKKIESDKNADIQQLKLLQLYYGLIQYNPKQVQMIEQQIQDQMKIDRYKIEVILSSLVIYENRYIMLRMSLINNRGQLINPNIRLLKQFLECDQDIDNINILDLMPKAIANVHDNFIDNYIYRGYSSLTQSQTTIHFQRQNGFILSAQLSVDHIQNLTEDFIITSLAIKPHSNPQLILFSENGQIIGMDESVFQIMERYMGKNIKIQEIIYNGTLIHLFIQNISQTLMLLYKDYKNSGQTIIYDVNDQWSLPKNFKLISKQTKDILSQTLQNVDDFSEIPLFDQNYNNQILRLLGKSEILTNRQVNYNLSFISYKHKNGQFVMFQLQINDHNQQQELATDSDMYMKSFKTFNQKSLLTQIQEEKSEFMPPQKSSSNSISEDNVVIQGPAIIDFKFINSSASRFLMTKDKEDEEQELIDSKFDSKADSKIDSKGDSRKIPLKENLPAIVSLNQKVKQVQKLKKIKRNQESVNSKSVSLSNKEDDQIFKKLSQDQSLIKPLFYASIVLFMVFAAFEIILILNVTLINSNLNNQIQQTQIIMLPQKINYVYTSIVAQMLFQYMKDFQIINMTIFMYEYNKKSIQIAYQYSQQTIPELCIRVPIIESQFDVYYFNQSIVTDNQLQSKLQTIEEINFKMLDSMLILINETRYDLIYSTGYIRLNIEQYIQNLDELIVNLRDQIQSNQLSLKDKLIFYLAIQFSIIIFLFLILYRYLYQIDVITLDMITIACRITVFQAQEQQNRILEIQKNIEYTFKHKILSEQLFEEFPIQNAKDIEYSRLLQSKMPSGRYFDKTNILFMLLQLFGYLIFISFGVVLYSQEVEKFLPGLTSTLNFVRFRHNFDATMLFGCLIKMDPQIRNNDLKYLNSSKLISEFRFYGANLTESLDQFVSDIYSSSLQENKQFDDILYDNLCLTYKQQLSCCAILPGDSNYSQYDDYSYLVKQGIVGYTVSVYKYVVQDFSLEFQSRKYANTSINNQEFQNIFLSYFTDVQDILQQFLLLFVDQNINMAETIIFEIQIYYLLLGNLQKYLNIQDLIVISNSLNYLDKVEIQSNT